MSDEPYSTEALARRCGVTVRTIHRWRKQPDFPAPVVERPRGESGGHDWSLPAVRAWLDERGEWDWAMDRAFAADWSDRKTTDTAGSLEKLIEASMASDSTRVHRSAERVQDAIDRLRQTIDAEEKRRQARAEVDRLAGELKAAKSRLRAGVNPTPSPANLRWRQSQSNQAAIREWARAEGIAVLDRGAISMRVVKQYYDAHPQLASSAATALP